MIGFREDNSPAYEAVPPGESIDKATFCRWVERQEHKYEWKDGRIVQMNNVSWTHSRIVTNLIVALNSRLDSSRWTVHAVDFGIETQDAIRYPDVIVEPFDASDLKRRRSHAPAILVEVLSPSSSVRDLIEKRAEYQTFESLEAYIVASQDEPICWCWQRGSNRTFAEKPDEIAGREAVIELTARTITLPLAEIYRGIPDL